MIILENKGGRKTIKKEVFLKAQTPFIAKHKTKLILRPGNQGIRFTVPFEGEKVIIPVDSNHTKSANGEHTTLVANSRGEVRTVEHLLSAFVGMGITDCEVELEGSNQVPVKDTSAETFVKLIKKAGISPMLAKRKVARVTEDIFFYKDGSLAILRPSERLRVSALIQFPGLIGQQYYVHRNNPVRYEANISWARSFIRRSCNAKVWDLCRQAIPALPEDITKSPVLVFEEDNWIVAPKTNDEPVRHKILDALGDLRTLGYEIIADITLVRPGHDFNRELVGHLASLINK